MPLTMIVTNVGRAALVNAQNTGTDPVTIAQIGISGSALVPSPTQTALPNELKRIATLSGDVVDDDTIHLVVRDESSDVYTIRSWGLYLADGTLFAIYGQAGSIIDKTASSIMLLAIDVRFADITAASLTFGNTNFLNPPATEQVQGVVQLATPAQALAGTDTVLVPPVKAIHDAVFAWLDTRFGVNNALVWNPNNDGAGSGLDAGMLAGQLPAYYTNIIARLGYTPLNAANYTAADILAKFITVDGAGSGADADLLDGQHGAYYLAASAYTAADVKTKMLTVDGAGSGLDADLLDGQDGAYYSNIAARLGFTPVRQGGGVGQGNNVVYIGWSASARLKATVDTTDIGNFVFDSNISDVWRSSNDGAGSGLDADLLDGQDSAYYTNITARLGYTPLNATSYTAADVKAKLLTVDGAGSGIDADLLDGQDGAYYGNIVARLGFTPVNRAGDTMTGPLIVPAGFKILAENAATGEGGQFVLAKSSLGSLSGDIVVDNNGNLLRIFEMAGTNRGAYFDLTLCAAGAASALWHSTNDGAGSGLDADLLDGQDSAYYTNITARLGYTPLNATSYTAADVKAKLLTVDGAGSGIDADLLDGQQGSYYLTASTYSAADVLAKLLTVDGAASGLDADLLDGKQASEFALANQFSSGSNANGYWRKMPDGNGGFIIEQWGRVIANMGTGGYTLTFPIPFTVGCESIDYQIYNSDGSGAKDMRVDRKSETLADATYLVDWVPLSGGVNLINGVDWRAIGR